MAEPGPIPKHMRQRFEVLQRAAGNGDLCLMSCTCATTGEPRYALCIAQSVPAGDIEITPLGASRPRRQPLRRLPAPYLMTAPEPGSILGNAAAEGILITEAALEIKEAIGLLKLHGADKDASSLAMDLIRAGSDLREVLMVREDADRLVEAATFDELDDTL
jgi:hypothetical protein